jgi:hypothetical protein
LQVYLHDQNVPPNVSDRKTVEAWYARLRQPATPAP